MEKKRLIILITSIIAIVLIVVLGSRYVKVKVQLSRVQETVNMQNNTNMEELKASKSTGEKFDKLTIGQTKAEVDNLLGNGEKIGTTESGRELYNYSENDESTYQLYFENDKLIEAGVLLNK